MDNRFDLCVGMSILLFGQCCGRPSTTHLAVKQAVYLQHRPSPACNYSPSNEFRKSIKRLAQALRAYFGRCGRHTSTSLAVHELPAYFTGGPWLA
eukprot:3885202-Pleurochrysis_carterae.AAC.4